MKLTPLTPKEHPHALSGFGSSVLVWLRVVTALIVVGTVIVLVGIYVCTESAERFWEKRRQPLTVKPVGLPPLFRTSHEQCARCGREGDLLNLDEVCRDCFDLQAH